MEGNLLIAALSAEINVVKIDLSGKKMAETSLGRFLADNSLKLSFDLR